MPKLILLLFLGFFAYLVFKGVARAAAKREGKVRAGQPSAPERMVACARCGVRVPESEGVVGAGGSFCSEEHRRLGAA